MRGSLNQLRFTVYDITSGGVAVPVGLTTLLIDRAVQTAEYLILLSVEARGRAFASEATRLTLEYGFYLSALRMIWLKVLEPNVAAIHTYETAGFSRAGRLRQAGHWLGNVCDELIYDITRDEIGEPPAWIGTSRDSHQ